jgi:hypothetical protein
LSILYSFSNFAQAYGNLIEIIRNTILCLIASIAAELQQHAAILWGAGAMPGQGIEGGERDA